MENYSQLLYALIRCVIKLRTLKKMSGIDIK